MVRQQPFDREGAGAGGNTRRAGFLMTPSALTRHLGLVLAVKAALLALLWVVFVRDAHVGVDAAVMAGHAGLAPPASHSSEGEHRE